MSLSLAYSSKLSGVETLTGAYVSPSNATVTIDQLTETDTLTGATTVPVTKQVAYQKAMSSGTATIDLTALPGLTAEETVSFSGLKVQAFKFRNLATNANSITVAKGASSGYGLNAAGTTWSVPISPGQSVLFLLEDSAPDVAGGAKTIDITGTLAQVLEVHIAAG